MRNLTLFISTIAMVALIATPSMAGGNGTIVEKFPFETSSYVNECCGDVVSISGMAHQTTKSTVNADGSVTNSVHINLSKVRGVGSTGINYVGNEIHNITETFTPIGPGPYTFTQKVSSRLVGKGKDGHACSFRIIITVRFAVDADGNVTVDDFDIDFDCANGNLE